ncbi:MAG TPA: MBL fold metallo-hydrolase [Pyrinomonadaceae bacterium]|nr:MBL fold metallo-hydrolase [Pyrinomonadaceae bacterium]
MKLTVFQSGKGDCLLLTGADGKRMLVDGGIAPSYSEHVAPALNALRANNEIVDVVYLSHIDDDHIGGILQMMDDEVAWRIHEFQVSHGNPTHTAPKAPRPAKMKAIWHNAFHDLVDDNKGEIEDMLAASSAILSGSDHPAIKELASEQAELVTSIAQSIQLTKRVGVNQLGLKLNVPAHGKLMLVRPNTAPAIKLGGMRLKIIGPFSEDLKNLRTEWNAWLEKNKAQLKKIQDDAKGDESQFSASEIDDIILPKLQQADLLSELQPLNELATAGIKLGDRKKVTTPNLASLMFFVEEAGKTLILTGDGHHSDIRKGLERIKKLKAGKGLHVDVLKLQHHGSEHNIDLPFCQSVTADNYVICGNGQHENPDLAVLDAIIASRRGKPDQLSSNPEAGNSFKIWMNCDSSQSPNAAAEAHMKEVEKLISKAANDSNGKLSFFFLKGSSFELEI